MALTCGLMHADYLVDLQSSGNHTAEVRVGGSINLDVMLSSTSGDLQFSAVMRVIFSSSGLSLDGCEWSAPYVSGSEDDDSKPALKALPALLGPSTLVPSGTTNSAVGIYLSNLVPGDSGFGVGRLVRLGISVPTNYAGPEVIALRAEVDGFANGFSAIPASVATNGLALRIVPVSGKPVSPVSVSVDGGNITVSWPSGLPNAVLEQSFDVSDPTSWVAVDGKPQQLSGLNTLSLPAINGSTAIGFRLRFR